MTSRPFELYFAKAKLYFRGKLYLPFGKWYFAKGQSFRKGFERREGEPLPYEGEQFDWALRADSRGRLSLQSMWKK